MHRVAAGSQGLPQHGNPQFFEICGVLLGDFDVEQSRLAPDKCKVQIHALELVPAEILICHAPPEERVTTPKQYLLCHHIEQILHLADTD